MDLQLSILIIYPLRDFIFYLVSQDHFSALISVAVSFTSTALGELQAEAGLSWLCSSLTAELCSSDPNTVQMLQDQHRAPALLALALSSSFHTSESNKCLCNGNVSWTELRAPGSFIADTVVFTLSDCSCQFNNWVHIDQLHEYLTDAVWIPFHKPMHCGLLVIELNLPKLGHSSKMKHLFREVLGTFQWTNKTNHNRLRGEKSLKVTWILKI